MVKPAVNQWASCLPSLVGFLCGVLLMMVWSGARLPPAQLVCPTPPPCNQTCPEPKPCPDAKAAPQQGDAAPLDATTQAANPSTTRFCPWSVHHSVFKDKELDIVFGRNESICVDAIIYGYDLLFEHTKLFGRMFWLGVPTQQDPPDMQVIQEVLWDLRPDVLIELGTNMGGGALAMASHMHLIEHTTKGTPGHKRMRIITIDPRDFHSAVFPGVTCSEQAPCATPDTNPLWSEHVTFIQGIPTDVAILEKVRALLKEWDAKTVMVSEDSGHEYDMVLDNVRAYKEFVSVGSYLLVQDTKLTRMWKTMHCYQEVQTAAQFDECYGFRKYGPGDSIIDFLKEEPAGTWEQDRAREYLVYTQHAGGWLKRLK